MRHKSQGNAVFIAIHPTTYRSGGFLAHGVLDCSSVFLRNIHCGPATGTNASGYYTIMHICNLRRLFIFCIISIKLTPAATASEPQNIFGCFRSSLFNDSHTSSTSIPCTSDFNFSFLPSLSYSFCFLLSFALAAKLILITTMPIPVMAQIVVVHIL